MVEGRADETLRRRKEKEQEHSVVPYCAVVQECRVDIEAESNESNESQHMCPNVACLVVDLEDAP